ncbi:hypothetical protein L6304_01115 [bacterium]|nr:hypothetical protein [bacterium]MCG2675779.1 hypothetical protein [bacterium]
MVSSELKVLKAVKEEGKATPAIVSTKTGFTPGYVNILFNSLIKGGYLTKTARGGYQLTAAGKKVFEKPEEKPKKKAKRKRKKRRKR